MVGCSRPAAASLLCRVNPRSDSRDGGYWEAAWWVGWEGEGLRGGDSLGKGVGQGLLWRMLSSHRGQCSVDGSCWRVRWKEVR